MNKPQLSAEMRKHCMCERCKDGVIHAACCAVHNMPAEPNGECDCEPETPAFSEDLSYYWQRILGEDWTNNQPLYELYLWVVKELATALEEQKQEILSEVEGWLIEIRKQAGLCNDSANTSLEKQRAGKLVEMVCDSVTKLNQLKGE